MIELAQVVSNRKNSIHTLAITSNGHPTNPFTATPKIIRANTHVHPCTCVASLPNSLPLLDNSFKKYCGCAVPSIDMPQKCINRVR